MIRVLSLLLLSATVREVTPPRGGYIVRWSQDWTVAFGYQARPRVRAFAYVHGLGVRWLDELFDVPTDTYIEQVIERPDGYLLLLRGGTPEPLVSAIDGRLWRLDLPRDPMRWRPGDFDLDGDVDQSDFGLWQRNPSVMPLTEFRKYMTGVQ